METLEVVRDLTLEGAAHFHASYVAKRVGIPTEDAHKQLAQLEAEGVVEVNFDVICPDNLSTIKTYRLREEIPWDEWVVEPTGDCEPFRLTENDIDVTYSPTQSYTQRLLRNGERSGSKKKTLLGRMRLGNLFRLFRFTRKPTTGRSTSISTSRRSTSRRHRVAAQR